MLRKKTAKCNEDSYLVILHLSRVELHCKLQEKLHRVTYGLKAIAFIFRRFSRLFIFRKGTKKQQKMKAFTFRPFLATFRPIFATFSIFHK